MWYGIAGHGVVKQILYDRVRNVMNYCCRVLGGLVWGWGEVWVEVAGGLI